jgi:N-methylhydantoinase A/oxoprolinase/acetone carboxylase beta subunit
LKSTSEFIHSSIEEEKRKQRGLGYSHEIISEIAETYVREFERLYEDRRDMEQEKGKEIPTEQEMWNQRMSDVLLRISTLTFKAANPFGKDVPLMYPSNDDLEEILGNLRSKEARDFIRKIKANLDEAIAMSFMHPTFNPLSETDIEIIRKIWDEAKYQLEKRYRQLFRCLPPEDWHTYIIDTAHYKKKLRLKIP